MQITSKQELLGSIEKEHDTFVMLLDSIPKYRYRERGVWGDGWSIKDLLAHLTAWEQMVLRWYREGVAGGKPAVPAQGFKWNQTPLLNQVIWRRYRRKAIEAIFADFDASYREIHAITAALRDEELFTPGYYPWTGENALITYLGANTCSHYRTATEILRRWLRGEKKNT